MRNSFQTKPIKYFPSIPLVLIIASSGCARLDYVKIPTATQYDQWDDAKQAKADAMKGVRYYLPRPFVHLKQSTPVAQRTVLVSFTWNESEKAYTLEGPEKLPTWVRKAAPQKISITQALALSLARSNSGAGNSASQGGDVGGINTNGVSGKTDAGPNTSKGEKPPSEIHARTGFLNSSDPVTRLGSRFDVVYLPDFEEQFVIQPKIGLGTADIETQLRNGWAAEVFSQKIDNSNLIPYVINQFESASEAAANIFTTWAPVAAGLPPNLGLPKQINSSASQGGDITASSAQDLQNFLGHVILFKLSEVRIAQPGLYPILKPSEMRRIGRATRGAVVLSTDAEAALDELVQIAKMPWIRQDMAFIPCPPFTVVGFNTTSDIFIAPATERIQLDAGIETGGTNNPATTQPFDGLTNPTNTPPIAPTNTRPPSRNSGPNSGAVGTNNPTSGNRPPTSPAPPVNSPTTNSTP